MSKKETAKRYILAIAGIFLMGIGVALARRSSLGVSPISSIPNVISIKIDAITLGYWLLIWNIILITGQIIILRRRFQIIQLLQIPLSVLFGWFTDFGVWLSGYIPVSNYAVQILLVIAGMITLAFGISLCVTANVIMNSGEAFVKAISDTIHKDFGTLKVIFDITCVVISVILSLMIFGTVLGTREGTVITAVFTGFTVKFISKRIKKPLEKVLCG